MDLAGSDQAGVVWFAGFAGLDQELTHDRSRIESAIDALNADGGTNIAAGVIKATQEILSSRHNSAAIPMLILLTDRQAQGLEQTVLAVAAGAKAQGIQVITIGLGTDANETFLQAIASVDTNYYFAPSSSDLAAIYETIGSTLICSTTPVPTSTPTSTPSSITK